LLHHLKEAAMTNSIVQRVAPWAGFLFVIVFVIGTALGTDTPMPDEEDSEIITYYEDSGNQTKQLIAAYALTLAGLAWLVFLEGLRERLERVEGQPAGLSRLGYAAGVLTTAMLFILAVSIAAVAGGAAFADAPVDAGVARFVEQIGFGAFLIGGLLSAALLITTTSVVTWRTNVLPRWTAWLGLVAAIVLLFGVFFITGIALLVWVLIISGVILMQREEQPLRASA
jgi:hypothetical protein